MWGCVGVFQEWSHYSKYAAMSMSCPRRSPFCQSKDRRKYLGVICEPVDVRAPLTMYLKMFQQQEGERERETTTRQRNKIKCNFYYAQWFLLPALSFYKFFAHCPCLVLSCLIFVYGMSSRYDCVCVSLCVCVFVLGMPQ